MQRWPRRLTASPCRSTFVPFMKLDRAGRRTRGGTDSRDRDGERHLCPKTGEFVEAMTVVVDVAAAATVRGRGDEVLAAKLPSLA